MDYADSETARSLLLPPEKREPLPAGRGSAGSTEVASGSLFLIESGYEGSIMEKFPVSKLLLFTKQLLSTSCVLAIVNVKT